MRKFTFLRRLESMHPRPRGSDVPELCQRSALDRRRAQGRPGAGRTHGPRANKMHGAGTTGTRRTTRPSLRSGLRLTPCSPRCTGLFGHRRPRDAKHHREFSISIGMPGPHGLAVRRIASRLRAISASRRDVHRIPRPTFVTIAKRPSFEHGTRAGDTDFGKNESGIFLREGLDRWNRVEAA
jgi:hypothetical protein